jgi:hypothetical protein
MGFEEQLRRAERLSRRTQPAKPSPPASGLVVPRTLDFVLGPDFLNVPTLFPKQGTLLKLWSLELDEFTDFDRQTINEWTADFQLVDGADGTRRYVGGYGIPPDILDRAQACRDEGCPWFHDLIMPAGRRSGKGFIMAIICWTALWWLFARPEGPHAFLHVPPTKRLNISVFAGRKDQAEGNLFRDIRDLGLYAPCIKPFIADQNDDTMLLYSPTQLADGQRPERDRALFEITARPATRGAGRGPASVMLFFDEMAFMVPTGASQGADEVFTGAAPANMQFGNFGFIGQASSPWQRNGRFHDNYQDALRVDTDGQAITPTSLVLQVPSWDMYQGWELTQTGLLTYDNGAPFPATPPAIITESRLRHERLNRPQSFGPEWAAQWAEVLDAYLEPRQVARLFDPWHGQPLTMNHVGQPLIEYHAHADPSRSGANFALVIAHTETSPASDALHVIVDHIKVWRPRDFPEHLIDYVAVEDELFDYIAAYRLRTLTFDQWNSASSIDHLRARVRAAGFYWPTDISEHTATAATNWAEAENFKTALINNVAHSPYHELAEQELLSLQWDGRQRVHPPTGGPCTTSDVADSLMVLTYRLLNGRYDPRHLLSGQHPHFGLQGGLPLAADQAVYDQLTAPWHRPPAGHHVPDPRPRPPSRRGPGRDRRLR